VSGQLHTPAGLPPVPIGMVVEWMSDPVWTWWRRGKFLASPGSPTHPSSYPLNTYFRIVEAL
jgi:hypothetical protein